MNILAWQQLPSVQITKAFLNLGYDGVVVDLEHSTITTQEAEAILTVTTAAKSTAYVRLPSADHFLARRMLDAGAHGLFVPVVEDAEALKVFIQHCYFPPKGRRGLGLVQANDWGGEFLPYYSNFEPKIIAQIETLKGAENIGEILKLFKLDGVMIGPFDLSADMGIPGDFENPEFVQACSKIVYETREAGKDIGFHQVDPDIQKLEEARQKDYDFIAYGTDIVAMRSALKGIKQ